MKLEFAVPVRPFFFMLLLLIAGTPAFIGMTNSIYLLAEIILGGLFTAVSAAFSFALGTPAARDSFFCRQ